jgi:hypothetical protein
MKIEIKKSENFNECLSIFINGELIEDFQEVLIDDPCYIGSIIQKEFFMLAPLNLDIYKDIEAEINPFLGFNENIEVNLWHRGNLVILSAKKILLGQTAGGFKVEYSSEYFLEKINSIISRIEQLKTIKP